MSCPGFQAFPDLEVEEQVGCVHHWIIDAPEGPVSEGRCRVCGEVREFRNYLESISVWDSGFTPGESTSGGRDPLSRLVASAVGAEEEDS